MDALEPVSQRFAFVFDVQYTAAAFQKVWKSENQSPVRWEAFTVFKTLCTILVKGT